MKKGLVMIALCTAVFAAGGLTAIAVSRAASLSKPTTNTNAGNDRRGDTDTSAECPPGYGGDPCIHNGQGHGNCDDNQGNGSQGNDNGNFRSCQATTTTSTTSSTSSSTASTTAPTSSTTTTTTSSSGSTSTSASASTSTSTVTTSAAPVTTTTSATTIPPTPTTTSAAHTTTSPTTTSKVALGTRKPPAFPLTGKLPFTGIPIWIAALVALALLAAGVLARRLAR